MSFPALIRRSAVVASVAVWASVLPVIDLPDKAGVVHRALELRAPGVIRAPVEFGLIGVTWPAGAADPSEVHVRTSLDGKRWSRWTELDADEEDGPDRGTEGAGVRSTTPLWVGDARFADVRVTGRLPRGARLHVIDPGPDPKGPRASVLASPGKPGIITRAQWGADESIRRCCPRYASSLKLAVIHHTATGNSYTAQQSAGIVRSIYAYHVQSNGWDDIGYNFLIDRHGQIFEGRAGGVDKNVIGAHAQGFNAGSSGVAVIGTFSSSPPPSPAWNALRHLVSWRLDRSYIDPLGSTTVTSGGSSRWPAGQKVTLPTISAHRDVGNTTCPGQPFYDAMVHLRHDVATHGDPKLYSPRRSQSVITPNDDDVADIVDVFARFSSSVNWKIEVLNASGQVTKLWSGVGATAARAWNGKTNSGQIVPHGLYRLRLTASNGNGHIRTKHDYLRVWRYPNGTLFRTASTGWMAILSRQRLRHPSSLSALTSRYRAGEAVIVPEALRGAYPLGADIGFRNGAIVRVDGKYWIISDQRKRPVSQSTLQALGYDAEAVLLTTTAALAPHPTRDAVTTSTGYPNGVGLRGTDSREAIMAGGQPRPFLTKSVRRSLGFRDVDLLGPADAQIGLSTTRAPVGFRDGTLLRSSSTGDIFFVEDATRRRFVSLQRFEAYGYNASYVRTVSDAELTLNSEGAPL